MRRRTDPDPRRELAELEKIALPAAKAELAAANAQLGALLTRQAELQQAVDISDELERMQAEYQRGADAKLAEAAEADSRADALRNEARSIKLSPERRREVESAIVALGEQLDLADTRVTDALMVGAPRTEVASLQKKLAALADDLRVAEEEQAALVQAEADHSRLLHEAEAERARAEQARADADRILAERAALPEAMRRVVREHFERQQRHRALSPAPRPKQPDSTSVLLYADERGLFHDAVSGRTFYPDGQPVA